MPPDLTYVKSKKADLIRVRKQRLEQQKAVNKGGKKIQKIYHTVMIFYIFKNC
jgi:hypothetical protein